MPRTKPNPSSSSPFGPGIQSLAEFLELERLNLPEKQEFVHAVAKNYGCREALASWKKKDLLQLLSLEMGKEMKYTGVSKSRMVDHLMNLITSKEACKEDCNTSILLDPLLFSSPNLVRRQWKGGCPSRLPPVNQLPIDSVEIKHEVINLCTNSACKAYLSAGTSFCKRCSCYICHQFDDNKDPSLWIVCIPDALDGESGCNLSCHIECALGQELAGVVKDEGNTLLDGSYRCESCRRVSDLIGCWRKQLVIAKDARRVDVLCQRLSLSYRLFDGTDRYKELHDIVVKATKKLQSEVGSITEGSAKLVRGIVNRLSSGADIQKLIGFALEKAESLFLNQQSSSALSCLQVPSCTIRFQDVSSASILVRVKFQSHLASQDLFGFKLWHRKANDWSYPRTPTFVIHKTEGTALFSNLQACTEYVFKVVPFYRGGDAGHTESRCFTKSVEVIRRSTLSQMPVLKAVSDKHEGMLRLMNVDSEVPHGSADFITNFKVRDLGKVLHAGWNQDQQTMGLIEDVFGRTAKSGALENEKQMEYVKIDEHVCPRINDLSSPRADTSSIEDGGCKSRQGGADASSIDGDSINLRQAGNLNPLDLPEELDGGSEEGRVTSELVGTEDKTLLRKDSSRLEEENQYMQCSKEQFVDVIKVTEADEASDPSNSQTARGEEIDVVSPVVSGSVQANGVSLLNDAMVRTSKLGSNGHGESWAVQVRMGQTAVEMKPQTRIIRKRTIGGLEESHNCYSLLNGCTETGGSTSVCAAKSYEFCVKIIRWLECEGHLKEDFRKKFLTWFSLRATDHEKRVVSVFIDTLQDNPTSLAEQLVDTFDDLVSAKRQQVVPHGFCNRLWH